jgi:hypothetical protein
MIPSGERNWICLTFCGLLLLLLLVSSTSRIFQPVGRLVFTAT